MRIDTVEFSINSDCEIIATPEVLSHLVSAGFATRVIAYYDGGLNREYHTLNTFGIKATTTYKGHLNDIPDTSLWSQARDLVKRMQ